MLGINKILICFLLISASFFISGCAKDEDNSQPGNNTNSASDPRDAIIGSWVCQEKSSLNGTSGFPVKITKNTSVSDGISLDNFYNIGFGNITAATTNGSFIGISNQAVSGYAIQGTGSVTSSTKININYTVNYNNVVDNCSAVLTKQ